jgi:hypothetical protein
VKLLPRRAIADRNACWRVAVNATRRRIASRARIMGLVVRQSHGRNNGWSRSGYGRVQRGRRHRILRAQGVNAGSLLRERFSGSRAWYQRVAIGVRVLKIDAGNQRGSCGAQCPLELSWQLCRFECLRLDQRREFCIAGLVICGDVTGRRPFERILESDGSFFEIWRRHGFTKGKQDVDADMKPGDVSPELPISEMCPNCPVWANGFGATEYPTILLRRREANGVGSIQVVNLGGN